MSSVQIIFQYLMLGVVVLLLLFLSSVVVTRQLFSLCRQPDEGEFGANWLKCTAACIIATSFENWNWKCTRVAFIRFSICMQAKKCRKLKDWDEFIFSFCGYDFELPYGEIGSKSPETRNLQKLPQTNFSLLSIFNVLKRMTLEHECYFSMHWSKLKSLFNILQFFALEPTPF